ncbi:MAG: hypothetical protein RLZZ507_4352 [Cyanobacteriota bacterium]|jgi:hypothetical protein
MAGWKQARATRSPKAGFHSEELHRRQEAVNSEQLAVNGDN